MKRRRRSYGRRRTVKKSRRRTRSTGKGSIRIGYRM